MGTPNVTCTPIASAANSVGGVDLGLGIIGLVGFLISGIAVAVGALAASAWNPGLLATVAVALVASCLMLINLINKAQDVLFHRKLACIDGEQCALGQVMLIENNPDGDLTFNLKLASIEDGTTPAEFMAMSQSSLVFSDPGSASRGWTFKPEAGAGFVSDQQQIPLLHCEVEGTYLNDWLTAMIAFLWTIVALAVAAIALAATELIPVVGWIISAVMAILAILAAIFGIHMAGSADSQDSSQPSVPVGQQVPGPDGPIVTDSNGNKVARGDFIALTGLHALDCGHATDTGKGTWCEIHPVRAITKVSQEIYDEFDTPIGTGGDAITVGGRICRALKDYLQAKTDHVSSSSQALEHPRIG